MKNTSPVHVALLASVLALAGAGVVLAQDAAPTTPTTPPAPPPGDNSGGGGGDHHHGWMNKVLTPDEQALLKKDTDAVMAANPDLQKEGEDLKGQRPAQDATDDDKQAFRTKMKDYHQKLEAAVEKYDAATTPIYAKLDAAMAAHHKGGGGGGGGQ